MLRSTKRFFGYDILAVDGEIGKAHDFYFDGYFNPLDILCHLVLWCQTTLYALAVRKI